MKMQKSNEAAINIVPAAAVPAISITNGFDSFVASPDFVTIFVLIGAGVVGSSNEREKKIYRIPYVLYCKLNLLT